MKRLASKLTKTVCQYKYFVIFLAYFAMTFIMYSDYIANHIIALSGDGCGYLNIFEFIRRNNGSGIIPLWNNLMNGGRPFATDFTNCVFYPIRFVFSFLPPLYFFYFFYSFHLALGSTYFTKYMEIIGIDKRVTYLMGTVYYFSVCIGGLRKSHLLIIAATIYLPVVLYYIEKYFCENSSKYLFFSSIAMTLQLLTGFPQYALYTDIVAGIYLIVREIDLKINLKKWFKDSFLWGIFYIGLSAIALIPFLEMSIEYSSNNAEKLSFEQFCQYSINPIRLIMMICPTIFGNQTSMPLPYFGSTGIDTEIFLGTVAFSLIVLSLCRKHNDYWVKVPAIFMAFTLLYASCGEIKWIGQFIYHIPIFNSFRIPSRIIFVFVFWGLVLCAKGMEELVNREAVKTFSIITLCEFAFIVICVLSGISVLYYKNDVTASDFTDLFARYNKTLVILIASLIVIYLLRRLSYCRKIMIPLLCTLLILIDTVPFWMRTNPYTEERFGVDTSTEQFLVSNSNDGNVLLAVPYISGDYQSPVSTSFNLSLGFPSINSYTAINNPRLSMLLTDMSIVKPQFNFSGLYTGFPEIEKNLLYDNDLLSMLGVKWIIDQENIIENLRTVYDVSDIDKVKNTLLSLSSDEIHSNELSVLSSPIMIEDEKYYLVSFTANHDADDEEEVYIDFYGGESYDSEQQQQYLDLKNGSEEYKYILYSGDIPDNVSDISFRIIGINTNCNISIRDLTIQEVTMKEKKFPYELRFTDDTNGTRIYENLNAKDILYTSRQVITLDDESAIYGHNEIFEFDTNSYILGPSSDNLSDAEITVLSKNTNGIKAEVRCESTAFVNFQQAQYPGWTAFIDGKKVDNYFVNGYIQGIYVPSGEHVIEFRYIPCSLYLGVLVSIVTFAVLVMVCVKPENNDYQI